MSACTYCGCTYGDTLDHVVPFCVISAVHRSATSNPNSFGQVVPCCKECNTLLGTKLYTTVGKRAAYLAKTLRKRYARHLRAASWTEDELAELGASLRKEVLRQISVAGSVLRRIRYCEAVALTTT
jgi:hypothetical protein